MSDLVFAHSDLVKQWTALQLGYPDFSGGSVYAIGAAIGGSLIGGVVFHNYYPGSGVVEISAASVDPRWLSRQMIRATFGYAFDVLSCQLVVMRIGEINTKMLNIAGRLGCESYTIPRLRGKSEAEVICTFTDTAWRSGRFDRRTS